MIESSYHVSGKIADQHLGGVMGLVHWLMSCIGEHICLYAAVWILVGEQTPYNSRQQILQE